MLSRKVILLAVLSALVVVALLAGGMVRGLAAAPAGAAAEPASVGQPETRQGVPAAAAPAAPAAVPAPASDSPRRPLKSTTTVSEPPGAEEPSSTFSTPRRRAATPYPAGQPSPYVPQPGYQRPRGMEGMEGDPFAARPQGAVSSLFLRDRYGLVRGEPADPQLKKLNQADAKMEKEAQDLIEQYRNPATDDQRAETKAKLVELTKKHFDLRQERRSLEISHLEDRLSRVRAAIAKRNEARDLIVQIRVSQLLGELELDDWSVPSRRTGAQTPAAQPSPAYR